MVYVEGREVRELLDIMQDMSHTLLLCLHVEGVVFVGLYLQRHRLDDLKPIGLETYTLDGIIGHEAHLPDTELTEDLCTYTIVSFVCLMTKVEVSIDGIETLLLELIGTDLLHEADATSFLIEVDDYATSFLLDELHSFVKLFATFTTLGAEDVSRSTA